MCAARWRWAAPATRRAPSLSTAASSPRAPRPWLAPPPHTPRLTRARAQANEATPGPGYARASPRGLRGGAVLVAAAAQPVSLNGTFFGLNAADEGGALYLAPGAAAAVAACRFDGSAYGGALAAHDAALTVSASEFANGFFTYGSSGDGTGGGAITLKGPKATATVEKTAFVNNTASVGGAVLVAGGASAAFDTCSFRGNLASDAGGAVALGLAGDSPGDAAFTRCHGHVHGQLLTAGRRARRAVAVLRATKTVRIGSCTFTGNRAALGGALFATAADAAEGDAAVEVEVAGSAFAGNAAGLAANAGSEAEAAQVGGASSPRAASPSPSTAAPSCRATSPAASPAAPSPSSTAPAPPSAGPPSSVRSGSAAPAPRAGPGHGPPSGRSNGPTALQLTWGPGLGAGNSVTGALGQGAASSAPTPASPPTAATRRARAPTSPSPRQPLTRAPAAAAQVSSNYAPGVFKNVFLAGSCNDSAAGAGAGAPAPPPPLRGVRRLPALLGRRARRLRLPRRRRLLPPPPPIARRRPRSSSAGPFVVVGSAAFDEADRFRALSVQLRVPFRPPGLDPAALAPGRALPCSALFDAPTVASFGPGAVCVTAGGRRRALGGASNVSAGGAGEPMITLRLRVLLGPNATVSPGAPLGVRAEGLLPPLANLSSVAIVHLAPASLSPAAVAAQARPRPAPPRPPSRRLDLTRAAPGRPQIAAFSAAWSPAAAAGAGGAGSAAAPSAGLGESTVAVRPPCVPAALAPIARQGIVLVVVGSALVAAAASLGALLLLRARRPTAGRVEHLGGSDREAPAPIYAISPAAAISPTAAPAAAAAAATPREGPRSPSPSTRRRRPRRRRLPPAPDPVASGPRARHGSERRPAAQVWIRRQTGAGSTACSHSTMRTIESLNQPRP
eukprot:tig00021494_g21915.t1